MPERYRYKDMKERKIKMTPEEVKDFVNKASQCDFDIDIFYNHFIIDAKSILGVMGLDFNSTLTVKYAGDNHERQAHRRNGHPGRHRGKDGLTETHRPGRMLRSFLKGEYHADKKDRENTRRAGAVHRAGGSPREA